MIIGYKHLQPSFIISKHAEDRQPLPKTGYERIIKEDCPRDQLHETNH